MALEKITKTDKIEIIGDTKILQLREAIIIVEDGVEIARTYHRRVLNPMVPTSDPEVFTDTEVSSESTEIQSICSTVWSSAVKQLFSTKAAEKAAKNKKIK